eukprot:2990259-Amphidinium_carterae.1
MGNPMPAILSKVMQSLAEVDLVDTKSHSIAHLAEPVPLHVASSLHQSSTTFLAHVVHACCYGRHLPTADLPHSLPTV